jgi:acetate kinase
VPPPALILVVNAGSSSLKLRLVDGDDRVVGRADLPAVATLRQGELAAALDEVGGRDADAVGHRVVHGGADFRAPVLVDQAVRRRLEQLVELAPLHQPAALAGLDAVAEALPGLPAVACFDTAFHATLPPEASTYAVPERWREDLGLRRYGFHGLSHAYAARRAATMLDAAGAPGGRLVTCHLGAGASLAAVSDGRSVDTTMGFTPLEGLVMATRSGSVDPGAVLWLVERAGLPVGEVADALEHHSGLAALAGTPDMAAVTAGAEEGDERARLALGVYLHRLRAGIAGMAAALGGVDAVVFTGGVGENAPAVRAGAVEGLPFLGVAVDPGANAAAGAELRAGLDADVTGPGAVARVLVVAAREEVEVARGVRARLG